MTTETKTTTTSDEPDARRVFETLAEAASYIEATPLFAKIPLVSPAMDTDGDIDASAFEGQRACVALLYARVPGAKARVVGAWLAPFPQLDDLIAQAPAWVLKAVDKELALVAARPLRGKDDLRIAAQSMPKTLDDYTSERVTASIFEVYRSMAPGMIRLVSAKSKAFAARKFTPAKLRSALESTAFATANHPALEQAGMFVKVLETFKRSATTSGLDPAVFDRWLETRDTFGQMADETEGLDIDFDDLDFDATETEAETEAEPEPEAEPTAPSA